MNKKLVLVSNALQTFKLNNLSNFENKLPENYLEDHLSYNASVESIGFHLRLRNKGAANDSSYPVFIQITKNYLAGRDGVMYDENKNPLKMPLKAFEQWHTFYIEESESYSCKKLNYVMRFQVFHYKAVKSFLYHGFPTKMAAA